MKTSRRALERMGVTVPVSLASCRYSPGTLIVDFYVPARPCPWKAPTTTRSGHAFKDKKLVAWQKRVATCCSMAMSGMAPYSHPVSLDLTFELTRRPGSIPDLSNLTKATEDSLQGIAIVNDKAVCRIEARRVIGSGDGVRIKVYSAEDA